MNVRLCTHHCDIWLTRLIYPDVSRIARLGTCGCSDTVPDNGQEVDETRWAGLGIAIASN